MPKDAPRPVRLPDEVWSSDDVLGLCRAQDADGLFRLAKKYGFTNESIGYWTGIDPGEISKRIHGAKGPVQSLDRWHRIADGLNMPDRARWELGIAPGKDFDISTYSRAAVEPRQGQGSVTRLLSSSSADALQPSIYTSAVDPQLPATLVTLLTQYARTDNMLGPRSLLTAVASQLAVIEQLWKIARGSVRSELLAAGARYAEFAGWLYQDAGDHKAAARWTLQALELAHAAESPMLASYVLMRRSNQASSVGDGARTLGLAAAALDIPAAQHPLLKALSLRQRARGYALDGNARECERVLEEAREQAAAAAVDQEPSLVRSLAGYCTSNYVEMEAADCWMLLGQPNYAVSIFEAELATWPADYRRDRGVHLARLASAYAACNEVERAQHIAFQAVAMAEQTGSSRVVDELGRSLGRLYASGARLDLVPLQERVAALASGSEAD